MSKSGQTSVTDKEWSGYPSASVAAENIEQVHSLILDNRRVITDEMANQLEIRYGPAYEIIHHTLHFLNVCTRWIPEELTE
jgi:hypothetical protein